MRIRPEGPHESVHGDQGLHSHEHTVVEIVVVSRVVVVVCRVVVVVVVCRVVVVAVVVVVAIVGQAPRS